MTVLGGAGLHLALAATRAGLAAAPVSVIGDDLAHLTDDPRLSALDWSAINVTGGASTSFTLVYDTRGELADLRAEYGVATGLTEHALRRIHGAQDGTYHVCCRRPLEITRTLCALLERSARFSLDFIVSSAPAAIAAAAPALPHAALVFAGAREYPHLNAATPIAGLPALVVTDGPRPVRLYRHGKLAATATPPPAAAARYAGAGDTLAGTFLADLACGLPDQAALDQAVLAASRHVTTVDLVLGQPPGTE